MTMPSRFSPYLLLMLANLFWAGNWIVSRAFRDELPPAALWILASVLAWSAYTLLLSYRPQVHPLSFLAAISVTGLVLLVPCYLWEIARDPDVIATPGSIAGILYTGIFPVLFGYILCNRAIADVGAARAGLFMHLVPAFGSVRR